MRPKTIDDIIGQEKTKRAIKIMVDSANQRNAAMPHNLFGGNAGTGKTTFALAIANELGVECVIANGGSISSTKDMVKYIREISHRQILFIDEIHRLSVGVCEWLYPVMEDYIYAGNYRSITIPEFTLIGATTEVGSIPEPLRDRFKFIHHFEPYTLDELSEIVMCVFDENEIKLKNMDIARAIAKTCRGNPRHVVNRTEWIRDYLYSTGKTEINIEETIEAIGITGFDKNGLTKNDHAYLKLLASEGQLSLKNIISKLRINEKTVMHEIEPYLISLGFINIESRGRYLNAKRVKEFFSV